MESRILKPALGLYVALFVLFLYGPFVVLTIISFNFVGDGLRDAADPFAR